MGLLKFMLCGICFLCVSSLALAQASTEGTILKWDTEAVPRNAALVRNGVVYYIQVDKTIYQVTRGSTKPDSYLVAGKKIQCRIEKDKMYLPDDKGKEVKYRLLGAAAAGE